MAAAAQRSIHRLRVICQECLRFTPIQVLREVRFHHARELLRNAQRGEVKVREIAALVGYSNQGAFGEDFRRRYGERPSHVLRRVSACKHPLALAMVAETKHGRTLVLFMVADTRHTRQPPSE